FGADDDALAVEVEAAGRHQRGASVLDLARSSVAAQLQDGLAHVAGALGAAFRETAAVGVDWYPGVDEQPLLIVLPVLGDEIAALAPGAAADVLEPVERDDREAVV